MKRIRCALLPRGRWAGRADLINCVILSGAANLDMQERETSCHLPDSLGILLYEWLVDIEGCFKDIWPPIAARYRQFGKTRGGAKLSHSTVCPVSLPKRHPCGEPACNCKIRVSFVKDIAARKSLRTRGQEICTLLPALSLIVRKGLLIPLTSQDLIFLSYEVKTSEK